MSQFECGHPGNFLLNVHLEFCQRRWDALTLETFCCYVMLFCLLKSTSEMSQLDS